MILMTNRIETLSDFFDFLEETSTEGKNHLFRGVRKCSYELTPSIGRFKTNKKASFDKDSERLTLKLFKQKAHEYLAGLADDDLAILTVAQHHGLPTRLLDWSKNPMVAAYFAVKDEFGRDEKPEDSKIYVYVPASKVNLSKTFDPFSIKSIKRFVPRNWNPRIIAQSGLFTIHPNPNKPWKSKLIREVVIANDQRKEIKMALNKLGVNHSTLFPDIDGIAEYIKWLRTSSF